MFGYIFPNQGNEPPKVVTSEDIPRHGKIRAEFNEDVKQPDGDYLIRHARGGRYLLIKPKARPDSGFWVSVKDFKSVTPYLPEPPCEE